ncbi:MAG TPA: glycosyltransferase family 2 protein, partial [Chthonomonadales bacterium]|nr:glycosyltransferase family 2 protein [Chthonomonadales bacterium]
KYYAAQGALAFPFQLTRSWFCAMMDSVRGGDDLLRFQAALLRFGGPIFGFHGENLLVNSVIEARIGWDFGPVYVEDAYFALAFMRAYPRRATFLQSCTYGGSPETVGDMLIQRRRWSHGLFGLLADRKIPWSRKWMMGYAIINWALGLFQHAGVIFLLAALLGRLNTSPVASAFIFIWGFNLAYQIWMYLTGLAINLSASQAAAWKYYVFPWLVVLLLPVFSFIEALAAILGFFDFLRGSKEFRVIKKSVS